MILNKGKIYKPIFRFNTMDFFIKKIFDGEIDNLVHKLFQKFSRGEFKNKAIIVAKAQAKGIYRISTTAEYADDFVRALAEKLGDEITHVNGVIITTKKLEDELDFDDKKLAIGVRKYIFDREMSGTQILELCEKYPTCFIGFSFKVGDSELKIKPKAPKSGSPSKKGGKFKVDFCKLKTSDSNIINSLIFDEEAKGFKEIEIVHDFIIDEIIISDELKAEVGDDYKKIKEMAKRKGKIIRKLIVDGREVVKEKEFEA